MATTTFTNINKIEWEWNKIDEESTQIWRDIVDDPKMKAVEAKVREA